MKFTTTLVIISSLLGVLATTPEQVISDIQSMSTQAIALDNSLKGLQSSRDLASAWAIRSGVENVLRSLKTATSNAKAVTPSSLTPSHELDAIVATSALTDAIVDSMDTLVSKKDVITAFPVPGANALVLQDLVNLKAASQGFESILLGGTQGNLAALANTMISRVNGAFDIAMAAYSS